MSENVALTQIGQIAIPVSNVARAVEFYRDRLGMKFLFQVPKLAFFDCGGIRLMLGEPEGSETPQRASIIYYRVTDLEAVHKALVERGVESVEAPKLIAKMPDHDLWMAFIKDPDGNTLGLMSELRKS